MQWWSAKNLLSMRVRHIYRDVLVWLLPYCHHGLLFVDAFKCNAAAFEYSWQAFAGLQFHRAPQKSALSRRYSQMRSRRTEADQNWQVRRGYSSGATLLHCRALLHTAVLNIRTICHAQDPARSSKQLCFVCPPVRWSLPGPYFKTSREKSTKTVLNTLRPRQDGRNFADDIFKCIFLNKNI